MPAFPELAYILGLIRRFEIGPEPVTQQQRHTDGNIGIAAEIGIDLQRVTEDAEDGFHTGVIGRAVEDTVDVIDSNVIGQDFFTEPVDDPEHRHSKLFFAQVIGLVDLVEKLIGLHNGAGHQVRKKADKEPVIENGSHGLDLFPVDIHGIGDGLEGKKGNAHREDELVDRVRRS